MSAAAHHEVATTAAYWHARENGVVQCDLCPHACVIAPGASGMCGVRTNRGGTLVARNFYVASSTGLDPIEKKPLYHFFPGSQILSFGTYGCNLACTCCQNFSIAKEFSPTSLDAPNFSHSRVAEMLNDCGKGHSLLEFCGVSYTYSEPAVWIETVLELAPMVRGKGFKNVLVTNGFVCQKPLDALLEHTDALNIDLKAFDDGFYRKYCGGRLAPVLETIKTAVRRAHVELTTLVIPTLNDSDAHAIELRDWIANETGNSTPVHLSRYFPMYKQTLPATSEGTLQHLHDVLREKLHYVYVGNMGGTQDTRCAHCNALAIRRHGYHTARSGVQDNGTCASCGAQIAVGK